MSSLFFDTLLIFWVGFLSYLLVRYKKELRNLAFECKQNKERLSEHSNAIHVRSQRIENEHTHFSALNCAVIYHLHASGTVYQDRIWDTYAVELNEMYDLEDRPLPDGFPFNAYDPPDELDIGNDEYNIWRQRTDSSTYADHPNERVDSDYIHELTESWI